MIGAAVLKSVLHEMLDHLDLSPAHLDRLHDDVENLDQALHADEDPPEPESPSPAQPS